MIFSETLRLLMEKHNESGYRLAKELMCSQATVSNWLSGANEPTRVMQNAIAAHYGVTVEELGIREKTKDRDTA